MYRCIFCFLSPSAGALKPFNIFQPPRPTAKPLRFSELARLRLPLPGAEMMTFSAPASMWPAAFLRTHPDIRALAAESNIA